MARRAGLLGVVLLLTACSGSNTKVLVPGTRIAVEEFTVADDAAIRRFDDGPLEDVGTRIAEASARYLQARRCKATAVPVATNELPTDLIVSGWVTKIDGGNLGGRRARVVLWIFCWPCGLATMNAGAAWFTVEGVVHRPDGTVVGRFETKGKGGGGSHEHATNQATQRIGASIAQMVYLGEYPAAVPSHRTLPARTRPAREGKAFQRPAAATTERSVADRLRELDALRLEGLISADEYDQRRDEILDDL